MLQLSQDKLNKVRQHALAEYPCECCGIIIGFPETTEKDILFRCTNIQNKLHAMDPETHPRDARTAYNIDPRELMKILKEAEAKRMSIKAFYHSHPDHDAYFSTEDRKKARRCEIRGIRRCQNAECGVILNRDRNGATNIATNFSRRYCGEKYLREFDAEDIKLQNALQV